MNRRTLLKQGASLAALASASCSLSSQNTPAKNDSINVALIGCGGRGCGAAINALNADPGVRLVALADMFSDQLEKAVSHLQKFGDRAIVDTKKCFTGFNAYQEAINLPQVDLVILATPPYFRPMHIEAAVQAKKHIFAEKPLATDVAGLKKVMNAVKDCDEKGLTFVTGFCYRFDGRKRETVQKIQEGIIGDITNVQCSYNTGALWMRPRQKDWSDMEWQLRNWLYFTWLSGDHIVEQAIHNIDKMAWVTGDQKPEFAYGMGGRQSRVDQQYGHIFDHFSVQYKFPGNIYGNFTCRQQKGTDVAVEDIIVGTNGVADLMKHRIVDKKGRRVWRFKGKSTNMYLAEHQEIMQSIRNGQPINNGESSVNSTAMGIMGRISAYTGKRVTWEMLMNSKEDLSPASHDLKAAMDIPAIARPGITPFI